MIERKNSIYGLGMLIIFNLCGLSFSLHAQEKNVSYDDLLLRIEKLEDQQENQKITENRQNHINSFLRNRISLGGFFESAFVYLNGIDTKSQANNTSNVIGINLGADFSSNLKFVSQTITGLSYPLVNEHNDPNATTLSYPKTREFKTLTFGALIAQGYLQYSINRYLQLQFGLGYTPFGYALQQREPPLVILRNNSQFTRTNKLAYPLWGGVHILGDLPIPGDPWGYHLYTFTPYYAPGNLGLGSRVWHSMLKRKLTFGLSSQYGKDETNSFITIGSDIRYQMQSFIFTLEFAKNYIDQKNDPYSAYLEIDYQLHQDEFLLYALISYANNAENETGVGSTALKDPFKKTEYSTGLNWLPTSYTRYRIGITYNDYRGMSATILQQNRDYYAVDLSVGVSF